MADEFTLTKQSVRVTATGKQPLDQSLDVSDYDEINALLGLLGVEETSSGVTVQLITGMQKDTEDGWVTLLTFNSLTTPNSFDLKNATTGLLKYVRWQVTGLGGASAIVMNISGMLRVHGA